MTSTRSRSVRRILLIVAVILTATSAFSTTAGATLEPQVVGGTPATIGDARWQVALLSAGGSSDYAAQFCGGSLITGTWVVTAAHCVTEGDGSVSAPSAITIVYGTATLSNTSYTGHAVDRIIRHGGYVDATTNNDIALIHLSQKATGAVTPIRLPVTRYAGVNGQITGWGSTTRVNPIQDSASYPQAMQKGLVKLRYDSACSALGDEFISGSMLCAGMPPSSLGGNYPIDTCQGDSGGPLAVKSQTTGRWELAGVTSWGYGCGWQTPGIYTNVVRYVPWILRYVPGALVG